MTQLQQIKINVVQVSPSSRPVLIHVAKIKFQSPAKNQSIVYYQLPLSFSYQPIDKLLNRDLFLPDNKLGFKIINYVKKTEQIIQPSINFEITNNKEASLKVQTKDGSIQITGQVLNQASQAHTFGQISLKSIVGYQKYYQFRKKYKTLENITRKIQFSIDHRMRLIYQSKENAQSQKQEEFVFSLDQLKDKQVKNFYLELKDGMELRVIFEEIVRIGDTTFDKIAEEGTLDMDYINRDNSYEVKLEMSQYLAITLNLKVIKNKNLGKQQFIAMRLLETSFPDKKVRIGSQQTINSINASIQLSPLLQKRYFDLQYGYLNQNLTQISNPLQILSVHNYLSKLTPSTQRYQHFINQKVLDLNNYKQLVFQIDQQKSNRIYIPVTYLLEGYNVFANQYAEVKFLLQTVGQTGLQTYQENIDDKLSIKDDRKSIKDEKASLKDVKKSKKVIKQQKPSQDTSSFKKFKSIPSKLFKLDIVSFLNLSQLLPLLHSLLYSYEHQFTLKIKSQHTIYTVLFQVSIAQANEHKDSTKQLQIKTEHSDFVDGQFVLTSWNQEKDKLLMLKSVNLQEFYLLEMTDTNPISIDFSYHNKVLMHGKIDKHELYKSGNDFTKNIILSSNGYGNQCQKAVISCHFEEIDQQIKGTVSNYRLKYKFFTEKLPKKQTFYYDLEIIRITLSEQDKKKKRTNRDRLAQKVQLQVEGQNSTGILLKQFTTNRSCFIQKKPQLQLEIKLRRMHYDVELNTFDNQILVSKALLVNRQTSQKLNQNTLTIELPQHHFREYEFSNYDERIKQKITLKLQLYHSRQPFGKGNQHVYRFKVPPLLWKMNPIQSDQSKPAKIFIESFTSIKKKNTQNQKAQLMYNTSQQVSLAHGNYNDGICIRIVNEEGNQQIGYCKIRECIKAKCSIVKNKIGWIDGGQVQWYFAVINMEKGNFYFLIKMEFDQSLNRQSSNDSQKTRKTRSKKRAQRSNSKGGPEQLAKTMKGFDLIKLKMAKNKLQQESRQLISKCVQRQQTISQLRKKIDLLDQENARKKQQMKSALEQGKSSKKTKKGTISSKVKQTYRNICECGQTNPQYMGYCKNCLQALRQKYELFFKDYQQKSSQYEMAMFKKFNLRDKIQTLKNKINAYKSILTGDDKDQPQIEISGGMNRVFEQMEEKQLVLRVEELKIELFEAQRQRQSQFERRSYQMNELQKKIKKQDQEAWSKGLQLNKLRLKFTEIKQQITQNTKPKEQ